MRQNLGIPTMPIQIVTLTIHQMNKMNLKVNDI